MALTRTAASNRANTGASDGVLVGYLNLLADPAVTATNFKVETGNGNQFNTSHTKNDPQYFMDETFEALTTMGAHDSKVMEFVAYELKDTFHAWFEIWERECSSTTSAPIWVEF
ncbi:hypothetical protein HAX54_025098 [Datura stramonium]|uniref:Uncharacterized protein n=1 Tax=Datura stramonium TaxID=4076 RepID=A0ABS8UYW2_DATST|nr:hypothetical protein [Datura stramonium]